jgi:hypothetical protein
VSAFHIDAGLGSDSTELSLEASALVGSIECQADQLQRYIVSAVQLGLWVTVTPIVRVVDEALTVTESVTVRYRVAWTKPAKPAALAEHRRAARLEAGK